MSRSRSARFLAGNRSGRFGSRSRLGGDNTMIRRIVPLLYLLVGLLVASQHSYLTNLNTAGRILSAALAVLLWPLVLLGVHLTIK
jgi:hypothetical protein